jgi:hypothetical protein
MNGAKSGEVDGEQYDRAAKSGETGGEVIIA